MTWTTIRHQLKALARSKTWREPSSANAASASKGLDGSRYVPEVKRAQLWRRRVLLRRGAHLYSTVTMSRDFVSLAMLDHLGDVVAFYERGGAHGFEQSPAPCSHVSQLYVPEDIAMGVPIRDLCSASIHGSSTQIGWRRRCNGTEFWASTIIRPILGRDGSLQGFSHVMRRFPTSAAALEPDVWSLKWPAANAPELGNCRFVALRASSHA